MSGPYYAVPDEEAYSFLKDNVTYIKDDIFIIEWQTRLFMFKNNIKVAELINGRDGLKKYHKDSFDVWVNKIKKKDLKKAEKMREDVKCILADADEIEQLWGQK